MSAIVRGAGSSAAALWDEEPAAPEVPAVFVAWLRRALALRSEGRCTRITMDQRTGDRHVATILAHWPIDDSPEVDAAELAAEIFETARAHAIALPDRIQLYEVIAHYGDDFQPLRRTLLRVVEPSAQRRGPGAPAEPATSDGLLAMMMRHAESKDRLLMMSVGGLLQHDHRVMQEQRARIAELEAREAESFEMYRTLTDRKHEREVEARRAELEEKRIAQREKWASEMFEKVSVLLPVLANRLAGQRAFPEQLSSVGTGLRSLLETITPEQFEALSRVFRIEQMIAFTELMRRFEDAAGPAAPPAEPGR